MNSPRLCLPLHALRKEPLAFLLEVAARGDLIRIGHTTRPVFLVNHPAFIRHVLQDNSVNYRKGPAVLRVRPLFGDGLTTADGERWQRQRRLLQPLFQHGRMLSLAPLVTGAVADLLVRWRALAVAARPVNIGVEMLALTRRIILRVLFGEVHDRQAAALSAAMDEALEEVNRRLWSVLPLPPWLPTPGNRRLRRALWTLHAFVRERIDAGRRLGAEPSSLLAALLALGNAPADDRWIRDEVMTALFAGHTTSAAALAWIWLLLDAHPQQERLLTAELWRVLPGRPPIATDLPTLPYTRMVIDEALRLYPPTWITARTAVAEDHMGGQGIPAGSLLLLSPWTTHRHPAIWPDPERFDPERFAAMERDRRPAFAYLPFGGGPRACIGQGFAVMEMQLVLATLARCCRVRLASTGPVVPEPAITLRPPRGTLVRLEWRGGTGLRAGCVPGAAPGAGPAG
jgi:cytochrome P450